MAGSPVGQFGAVRAEAPTVSRPWCGANSAFGALLYEMDVTSETRADSQSSSHDSFTSWFVEAEPRLRAALVCEFGSDIGRDATAVAVGYVWEHRERVLSLEHPVGYAFRIGQRWARRQRSPLQRGIPVSDAAQRDSRFEPGLHRALEALPVRQRQVVVLCIGFGLTHAAAAALLGISRTTVQNHAERGLLRLQREIGT